MGYVMSRVAGFIRTFALLPLVAALSQAALAQTNAEQETHAELILDASGSMFNRLADGRYRIVAAKEVLAELIAALPASPDLNVGYRAYGSELQATAAGSCEDSRLYVPIEGVQRQLLLDTVKGTQARGATPIAYSLQLALNDLQGRSGQKLVVLITDGEEGCGGDVRAAAEALQAAGIDLRIIGFDLNDAARAAFQGIGVFENATSAAELLAAKADWPALYDLEVLGANRVPAAAALYFNDMYVDLGIALESAAQVPNLEVWVTSEYEHNGLRADGAKILGRLMDMLPVVDD